jgi:hypothetical protein
MLLQSFESLTGTHGDDGEVKQSREVDAKVAEFVSSKKLECYNTIERSQGDSEDHQSNPGTDEIRQVV